MTDPTTTDPRTLRRCVAAGALLMLLGVILGAFGAHALQQVLSPRQLASYQTGVLYQQLHALALVLVGLLAGVTPRSSWSGRAAALFGVGIVLFSGSIYAMAAGAPRALGVVTPIGGVSFMLGWACVALQVLRRPSTSTG
ncbi:MAG TPA: DUF423 domain-containing protein [Steroidobacteraceae bacterium]|nr:DUF423 domain-containing protein [Steroidobacteraceae bacterium]